MNGIFDRWPESPVPAELIETRKPEAMNESKLEPDDYWDKCREILLQAATTICFQTGEDTPEWSVWLANGGLRELLDAQYLLSKLKPAGKALVDAEEYAQLQASHRIKMENQQQPVNAQLLEALKGLYTVCEIALSGKDGKQYTYFETRAGHFVEATLAMQSSEAAIAAAEHIDEANEMMHISSEPVMGFKREHRYDVVKLKTGNKVFDCLVIEKDWPEYEMVWAMIEARMTGKQQPPAVPDGYALEFLQEADLSDLCTFIMRCEDHEADGHSLSKTQRLRLCDLGVIRNAGFGRYAPTSFGMFVFETYFEQNPSLPLRTDAEHNEISKRAMLAAAKEVV